MKATDNPESVGWTGWLFTDCRLAMNCPRCGVKYGEYCRTPKGRKSKTPHSERTAALIDTGYSKNMVFTISR